MKRIIVFTVLLLTSICVFAQTQYDYYEGKNSYGGVDTAILGFKILGIILLVIAAMVIIGGILKLVDYFNPPKNSSQQNEKIIQEDVKPSIEHFSQKTRNVSEESEKYVDLDFIGNTIEAEVTIDDGSKKNYRFWYEIHWITLHNQKENFMFHMGDEIVKPAGSISGGICVKVKPETKIGVFYTYRLKIKGKFDPKKLQLIRVDGYGYYDKLVYYYDGETQLQNDISNFDERRRQLLQEHNLI